jgi:hypothetical protein
MHRIRFFRLEGIDQLPLAQQAQLVVDQVEHAIGMADRVLVRLLFRLGLASGIPDENRLILLPYGLRPVVYASVGEDDPAGERSPLEIVSRMRLELGRVESQLQR